MLLSTGLKLLTLKLWPMAVLIQHFFGIICLMNTLASHLLTSLQDFVGSSANSTISMFGYDITLIYTSSNFRCSNFHHSSLSLTSQTQQHYSTVTVYFFEPYNTPLILHSKGDLSKSEGGNTPLTLL
jgi:hypothetical protein